MRFKKRNFISQVSKLSLRRLMAPVQHEKLIELKLECKYQRTDKAPPSGPHAQSIPARGVQISAPATSQSQLLTLVFKALQGHLRAVSHRPPTYTSPLGAHLHQPRPRGADTPASLQGPGLQFNSCPCWRRHWGLMQPPRPGAGLRWRSHRRR